MGTYVYHAPAVQRSNACGLFSLHLLKQFNFRDCFNVHRGCEYKYIASVVVDFRVDRKYVCQFGYNRRSFLFSVKFSVLRSGAVRRDFKRGQVQRSIYFYVPSVRDANVYETAASYYLPGRIDGMAAYAYYIRQSSGGGKRLSNYFRGFTFADSSLLFQERI